VIGRIGAAQVAWWIGAAAMTRDIGRWIRIVVSKYRERRLCF
jgi:hypothetical protein